MKVARKQLAAAIAQKSRDTTPAKLANSVAAYLLEEHRTGELDSLMRDVMQERSEQGIVEVTAVSAHALDQRATTDVKTQVGKLYPNAKEIIVSPRIEPALIGGLRLEFANSQLDMSIKSKLNHLRQLTSQGKDL